MENGVVEPTLLEMLLRFPLGVAERIVEGLAGVERDEDKFPSARFPRGVDQRFVAFAVRRIEGITRLRCKNRRDRRYDSIDTSAGGEQRGRILDVSHRDLGSCHFQPFDFFGC